MVKYRIIGCMTGNSMDAVDLVLTEFDGENIRDICAYSKAYNDDMRNKVENLRKKVFDKTKEEIFKIEDFFDIHDEYIKGVADAVEEMCLKFQIDKKSVDAIGFHGKTLDHNPVSRAKILGNSPYTLQMGSGQMLADLVGIRVVYDFRSSFVMRGKEGAPLVGRHNANIAKVEGDGVYFNGGNTSNFAVIKDGKVVFQTDVGPFNEYVDMFVRKNMNKAFDRDGEFGKKGKLDETVFYKLYDIGKDFYEIRGEKSGDPQYYKTNEIMKYLDEYKGNKFDLIYTLEYWSAYLAVRELLRNNVEFDNIKLFGGGWKNPIVKNSFIELLSGKGEILEKDRDIFREFYDKNKKIEVNFSEFGEFMEARLMADMARYKLEDEVWTDDVVSGVVAECGDKKNMYFDAVNLSSKGW